MGLLRIFLTILAWSGAFAAAPQIQVPRGWSETKSPIPAIDRFFQREADGETTQIRITAYGAPSPKTRTDFNEYVKSQGGHSKASYRILLTREFSCKEKPCYSTLVEWRAPSRGHIAGAVSFRQGGRNYLMIFSLPSDAAHQELAKKILSEAEGAL